MLNLRKKTKRSESIAAELSQINFKKKTIFKSFRKSDKDKQSIVKAPLLVLQTDDDGLAKLKLRNNDKFQSNQSLNNSTDNAEKSLNSPKENTNSKNLNLSFDQCEISEKITTV